MVVWFVDVYLFIGCVGVLIIVELIVVGCLVILILLFIVIDDYQVVNVCELFKVGGVCMICQECFIGKELVKQIKVLVDNLQGLNKVVYVVWNCGWLCVVEDFVDFVESFGGVEMMDVIWVGGNNVCGVM